MAGSINCIDNKTTDSTFFVENTDVSTNTSNLDMRKNRAGAAVNSGDTIGNVRFMGFDGSAYQVGARIYGITDGTIAAGRMPTDLFFNTSPDFVSGDLLRMQIAAAGNVTIATPDSGVALTIAGGGETITAGNLQIQSGNLFLPNSNNITGVGVIYFGGNAFIANWGSLNTFVGEFSGNPALSTARQNTGVGSSSLESVTTGQNNIGVGTSSFLNLTTGTDNTGIGFEALFNLVTGQQNIGIGLGAGRNYTTSESSNIIVGNNGVVSESNTIRIGTQGSSAGQQDTCYIAGITGVSVSNLALVSIDTVTGQLGSTSGGSAFLNALNGDSGTATPSSGAITIAGGTNISTSAAGSTVTINATGAGSFAWTVETGAAVSMVVNHGYIANNAGTCVLTLPAVSAVGDRITVSGMNNATGWQIAQNGGNTIFYGNVSTTPGAGGSLASSLTYDTVDLVCNTANATWIVIGSIGTISVV